MGTLPTLQVLLDNGTGTFPYDISSKVLGADGYQIVRGRSDWIGAVTTGELTLTLNNSDGRFTPGSTILGTPSPITVDQRIRVIENVGVSAFGVGPFGVGPFGAGSGNSFTGYVKSWPVSWPAVVSTFATVQITATDAQARAERRTLRSLAQEEMLSAGFAAYYPLDEAAELTSAADLTGQQTPLPMVAIPGLVAGYGTATFGTDLGIPVASTGVTFTQSTPATGGSVALRLLQTASWTSPSACITAVFVQNGSLSTLGTPIAGIHLTGGPGFGGITFDSAGHALWNGCTSPANLMDGKPHVISAQAGGGLSTDLWVDGVKVGSAAVMSVTWDNGVVLVEGSPEPNAVTTWGHFAYGPRLADAEVSDIHAALVHGFAGESATARVTRLAGYASLPIGTLDTAATSVAVQDTVGVSAWDAMEEAADAEFGLVFVNGSGNLTFHNRARNGTKIAPDLILDSQYVTPDVTPVVDDQQIVNYVEATAQGTGALSLARSTTSETSHGRYPVTETYLVQTDAEALDRASWIVAKQAEPGARYGTLTINLYKMSATLAATVIAALELDCWLRVTSLASQNPGGSTVDVVVQGFTRSASNDSWSITCNVVSRSLYTAALWDDAGSLWDSAIWAF